MTGPSDDPLDDKLARLYLNLLPLSLMALRATRKSDRDQLSAELTRIRLMVAELRDFDPMPEQTDISLIRQLHATARELLQRYVNRRDQAIEAGDVEQATLDAANAAACETMIGAMRAFWNAELQDA